MTTADDRRANRDLADCLNELFEFWDNGTPVHPNALVVDDLRAVLAQMEDEENADAEWHRANARKWQKDA